MIDTFRPADTRCGHPATITPEQAAPDHRLGYYLSTYCEHGAGDGREQPNQCRAVCKTCHAPCACRCHGADGPLPGGFDLEREEKLRTAVRQVIRDLGVVPHGPRGDELLTSIVTSALHYLDRDGAL
jgi:hypothetical protein